jgi:hypothetical protein
MKPQTATKAFTFPLRMSPESYEQLRQEAVCEGISPQYLIQIAITEKLVRLKMRRCNPELQDAPPPQVLTIPERRTTSN